MAQSGDERSSASLVLMLVSAGNACGRHTALTQQTGAPNFAGSCCVLLEHCTVHGACKEMIHICRCVNVSRILWGNAPITAMS